MYNKKEKDREHSKTYHKRHRDTIILKKRFRRLRDTFKISMEDYDSMLKRQNNKCAACGKHQSILSKSLAVDHSHKTGVIRELLCTNCNLIVGLCGESIEVLEGVINYLAKYGDEKSRLSYNGKE